MQLGNENATEHARTALRLARALRSVRMLAKCRRMLVSDYGEAQLVEQVCKTLADTGGYLHAGAIVLKQRTLEAPPSADYVSSTQTESGQTSAFIRQLELDGTIDGLVARRKSALSGVDPALNIVLPGTDGPSGTKLILPLESNGDWLGALIVVDGDREPFDAEEIGLLEILSEDFAHRLNALRVAVARDAAELQLGKAIERFELAARATNDVIWDWDIETNAVWWSTNFQTLFGYRPDQLEPSFNSWSACIHPQDRTRVCETVDRCIADCGSFLSVEYRFLRADQTYADIYDRCHVVWKADGKPVRMIGAMMDVSDRKKSEDRLRQEQRLLETIINAVPDYIYVKDLDGRFQLANRAWLDARGWTLAEVQGKTSFDLYPHVVAHRMYEQDKSIIESGVPQIEREQWLLIDSPRGLQDRRWSSTSKVPLLDQHGKIVGVIGISRDITERRRMETARAMEHAVVRVLAESSALEPTMQQLIETMCDMMGWNYGAYWTVRDAERRDRAAWWSSSALEFEAEDRSYWLSGVPEAGGEPLLDKAWLAAMPGWLDDVQGAKGFRRKPSCSKLGFRSAFAFPILAGSSVIGAMEFFGKEARAPDAALLDVTGVIGTQIGELIRRKKAEEFLQESEQQLRAMFDYAGVGIVMTGRNSQVLRVNDRYCEIVGYREDELLEMDIAAVNLEENLEAMMQRRADLVSGNATTSVIEKPLLRKDATVVWVSSTTSVIRDNAGEAGYFISVIQDISESKRAAAALKESEELFRQLTNNIPQAFWMSDASQKQVIYVSPACENLLGMSAEDLKRNPRSFIKAVHPDDRRRVYAARQAAAAGTYNETYRVIHADGSVRWVQDRAFPVESEGSIHRIAGIVEDVTERKQAEERLTQLAHFDVLTQLPNRTLFFDRLNHAVAQAERNRWIMGVMLIDVDRFKQINDTMGHDVGDNVLQQIARRLSESIRAGDTVGRLGGDEFAIVLSILSSRDDAAVVARKILQLLKEPLTVDGAALQLSGSIGITVFPHDSTDRRALIKNADIAMYRAKQLGKNRYQFYEAEMRIP